MDTIENDELIPTDTDGVENLKRDKTIVTPQFKDIPENTLSQILTVIKNKKIGFKFGDVYFRICHIDKEMGTFTAKPVNKILPDKYKIIPRNNKKGKK